MSWLNAEEVPEVDYLSQDECWEFLEAEPLGRLGVRADAGVDIFPVNFTVHDQAIYIRSAPGAKLVDLAHSSSVAFEIDGSQRLAHWSVVVRGIGERMSRDSEIENSGVLDLATMTSSAKWNYVRITPFSVSGRRFNAHQPPTA